MYVWISIFAVNLQIACQWKLQPETIVFGNDIVLTCNAITCSRRSIKTWIGGPQYKVLCYEGYSVDSSKYEIMISDISSKFELKIKTLDNDDVDCKYTCSCGIQQDTEMLVLDAYQYIYPPRIDRNSSYLTENEYNVDIVIEVYPLPTCYIEYEEAVIQVNSTSFPSTPSMFNESSSRIDRLYKLRIQHTLQKKRTKNCKLYLHLFCEVGSVNYTVLLENDTKCKDSNDSKETMVNIDLVIMVVITVTTALVIVIVVLVMCLTMRRCIMWRKTKFDSRGLENNSIDLARCEPLNHSTIHQEKSPRSIFFQDACKVTKQRKGKLQPRVTLLLTDEE